MSDGKDKGFTKEQLEELQIDSALGGDIPIIGIGASIGRKTIPKLLEAGEKVVKDVYEHYAAKKAAEAAAKKVTIAELRTSMKPLGEFVKEAVENGKMDAGILNKSYKGGDMFAKNSDELRRILSDNDYRNYAKLALHDEELYRQGLSTPGRFVRAFHYDNANPEVGYLIGTTRYGGTFDTHLRVAAADSELEGAKIAVLSFIRGAAQTVALAKGAADAVANHYENQKSSNEKVPAEKPTSDQVLGEALKLSPELNGQVNQTLAQIRDDYSKMNADEKAKIGDENTYMDKAKLSIAKEIATMKLEQHEAQTAVGANQRSDAGNRDIKQQLAAFNQHIDSLPEHQQQTARSAMALYLNKSGVQIEETHTQNQAQQQELA